MTVLPATIAPLVPRARYVIFRPYTSIGVLLVPNLGLRLIFPRAYAATLTFAVTNSLFKSTRLGPNSLLLTVAHGLSHRYCGDVFISAGPLSASVLVCTSDEPRGYASDIIFVRPPPKPGAKRPARQALPVPVWRRVLASVAFGQNPHEDIKKQAVLSRADISDTVSVSRFILTHRHAVLGFAVTTSQKGRMPVARAALYRGRKTWRRVAGVSVCRPSGRPEGTRCALIVARPKTAVSRWHLVVMVSSGVMRLSW